MAMREGPCPLSWPHKVMKRACEAIEEELAVAAVADFLDGEETETDEECKVVSKRPKRPKRGGSYPLYRYPGMCVCVCVLVC